MANFLVEMTLENHRGKQDPASMTIDSKPLEPASLQESSN